MTNEAIAIVNAAGRVVTLLRPDLPEGFAAPDGCTAIPQGQLPAGWQMEPERHDIADVRRERNLRLTASDWTQLSDAPVDPFAWATYRQALRDLPAAYGGTGLVPWPTAPTPV